MKHCLPFFIMYVRKFLLQLRHPTHRTSARFSFTSSFPSRNCWQNYVDFHRCINLRGVDYQPCYFFKTRYHHFCPSDWVNTWDEQREEGRFPVNL